MNFILSLTLLFNPSHAPLRDEADVGTIKAGAPLQHAFTVSNLHLTKPMTLAGIVTSCGCTSHTFAKASLKPGEVTTVTVKVNTLAHAAGAWRWTASVRGQIDGEADVAIPLALTGTLVREVSITPTALAISTDGAALEKVILIKDVRFTPFKIASLTASSPHITARLDAEPLQTRKLTVAIAATLPYGDHSEAITITTNDPVYPEFRIPVTVAKRTSQAVIAAPEQVELSSDQSSMLVQLRRKDGKPITIAECACDDKTLQLTWSKEIGTSATLRVKLPAVADRSGGQTTVTVKFAEPAMESLTVPVKWNRN